MSNSTNILLVGVTGFVGKVVLERLLQDKGIEKIFVVLRPKKKMSVQERFKILSDSPCFKNCQNVFSNGVTNACPPCQVVPLQGDITKHNLGLSNCDLQGIQSIVTHVISLAASVDFDLPLKQAVSINVGGPLNVLDFVKSCQNIERFCHCSTAYVVPATRPEKNTQKVEAVPALEVLPEHFSNGQQNFAQETYARIANAKHISEDEERNILKAAGLPNTYAYSKALAELILDEKSDDVPLVIVRPSMIGPCLVHPFPGWVDCINSIAGWVFLYGGGILHTSIGDPSVKLDVVPCDYVVERLLYATFKLDLSDERKIPASPIIHATAGHVNSLTYAGTLDSMASFFKDRKNQVFLKPFWRKKDNILSTTEIEADLAKDKKKLERIRFLMKVVSQKKAAKKLHKMKKAIENSLSALDHTAQVTTTFIPSSP